MEAVTPPIALTIAGSDSGGGAGIQADLATFRALHCHGTSVITAVTAQNTLGVAAIHAVPPEMVSAQLDALANDLPPRACKTGMLATAAIAATVAAGIQRNRWPLIVDPVLAATSGDALVNGDTAGAIRDLLLPLATCVTPNLGEAAHLSGLPVTNPDEMVAAAQRLLALGAASVLITGGHLDSDVVVDVLVTRDLVEHFPHPRTPGGPFHGTGCTLSAALTAFLARGADLRSAVTGAIDFVTAAIRLAPRLGRGARPLGLPVR